MTLVSPSANIPNKCLTDVGSRILFAGATVDVITVKSDSSGDLGWGYVFGGALHFSRLSSRTIWHEHIQTKEFLAIAHCCQEHGHLLRRSVVRFGVDNSSAAFVALRGRSSCPRLQHLSRVVGLHQIVHAFDVFATHVSRSFNELADCLTRFACVQELLPLLPDGVGLAPASQWRRCRSASPASDEPVYYIPLRLLGAPTSPTPRT